MKEIIFIFFPSADCFGLTEIKYCSYYSYFSSSACLMTAAEKTCICDTSDTLMPPQSEEAANHCLCEAAHI